MTDYKKTLNLPRTSFPMRANLPQNEPKMIDFWAQTGAYEQMIASPGAQRSFVLHDGPPYANGHIHLGTAMNKILKDIIVKSRNLQGQSAQYVPGWDCHGLPIELKVEQERQASEKDPDTLQIRKKCREYALKYLDIQREEFRRLGVLGKWEQPYLTMHPEYEAATAKELGRFMERGNVKRHKKPIYWCPSCETALAEAEVEYGDHSSPSIYVRFPVPDPRIAERFPEVDALSLFICIWTTTPWTIPSNQAVAVHPDFDYVLVRVGDEAFILAEKLLQDCSAKFGWSEPEVMSRFKGSQLEGFEAEHPFYSRSAVIVLADYVTLETGTGCVHTAPGHGQEDYETGLRYDLDIYAPLDDQGRFLEDVDFFAGLTVFEANPVVIEKIRDNAHLLAHEEISHSYPHCWRCKKPVIFRATTQWFISMDHNDLRTRTLEAIDRKVRWIPSWGRQRIRNMIAHRPDWCISRQRSWGVPIIALICNRCNEAYSDPQWVFSIVDRFAQHERGADYWFETPVQDVIPEGLTCPSCQGADWRKETDILDVWFDSGTSYAAVLEKREECSFPADMYLEGSDQHRGWFHSSLLAAMGTRDVPPYASVLTHGFVVDGEGKKMSKSIGNVIAPQDIISKYGAEILRMWVSSENYQEDLRISEDILKQLVDNYRRIRNTCRFMLGNLSDFSPEDNALDIQQMLPFDRYVLNIFLDKHAQILKWYDHYELHKVFHTLHNLCVNELSAFYLDILKDRLYVSSQDSHERRSAQTALFHILLMLVQDMAPILSFTAEEVYQHLPGTIRDSSPSVFGFSRSSIQKTPVSDEEKALWDMICLVRQEVTKAIEPKRKQGIVGHSLDVSLTLYLEDGLYQQMTDVATSLREIFILSQVAVLPRDQAPDDVYVSEAVPGLSIGISPAAGQKCPRCWVFSETLDKADPDQVCPRCSAVLEELQA